RNVDELILMGEILEPSHRDAPAIAHIEEVHRMGLPDDLLERAGVLVRDAVLIADRGLQAAIEIDERAQITPVGRFVFGAGVVFGDLVRVGLPQKIELRLRLADGDLSSECRQQATDENTTNSGPAYDFRRQAGYSPDSSGSSIS